MHVRTLRRLAAACACACVAAVAACSGDDPVVQAGSGSASAGSSGSSGTATPSARPSGSTAATATAGPTAKRTPGPPARRSSGPPVAVSPLPPAPVGKDAIVKSGVAITMAKVQDVQVPASGPGEIAGPGVAVTIRVRNTSNASFDLSGLAVVASYGKGTPAAESGSAKEVLLRGGLAPGRTADGTYYFLVPAAQASTLRVEVSSSSTAAIAVFER